jgi:hypothetical protein
MIQASDILSLGELTFTKDNFCVKQYVILGRPPNLEPESVWSKDRLFKEEKLPITPRKLT